MSGHWTDDRLLEYLYGAEQQDAHFQSCAECKSRLAAMQAHRRGIEAAFEDEVSFDFLAEQRRNIYARFTERARWWSAPQFRRWASAAATLLILGSGILLYEERQNSTQNQISDAQLAEQVSNIVQDTEPKATAPLQALFEE